MGSRVGKHAFSWYFTLFLGKFRIIDSVLFLRVSFLSVRVAEVAREHGWHPPKSLDSDENFKPEHTLFCRKLIFVVNYALFGDLLAKKGPFG